MKTAKIILSLALLLVSALTVTADPSGNNVVISEVLFNAPTSAEIGKEWIELYNPTSSPIDIGIWSIYKSGDITPLITFLSGTTIPAHGYILIGDDGTLPADLPTPDYIGFVSSLSNGGDGLQLLDNTLAVVDAVGWGSEPDSSFYEGSKISSAPDGNSIERKQGGSCGNAIDTDNNADDFFFNPDPTPQNSLNATVVPCNVTVDTTPPGTVSNLIASNITNTSARWSWTNPPDSDFDGTIIYINGVNEANFSSSATAVQVSGLTPNTQYTIVVHTIDTEGNVNDTNISNTITTLSTVSCSVDADCDNGLYCDGAETCNAGVCQAGSAVVCDDGLYCNGAESCNEATDSCDAGTAPAVDDGVSCTVDSCNETTDSIDHVATDSLCDNGLYCDGAETCDAVLDCQAGTVVVCDNGQYCDGVESCNETTDSCDAGTVPTTDDGVSCTVDSCDEVNDVVVNTPTDSLCDNGLFCDGAEYCDATLDCQTGVVVDCSVNDITGVNSCINDPDSNNATLDTRSAFASTCDEVNDVCTTGDDTVANACSFTCGAGCESDLDCGLGEVCDLNSCGCVPSGAAFCGDNTVNNAEVCDGTDLDGVTCQDFGYTNTGNLACDSSCDSFDVSGCTAVCGDGTREPGEQCDDGNLDNDDGCSSTCELEHNDDLMINYIRGHVTFDGVNATNETMYTVDIVAGDNVGMSFNGYVENDGSFDTDDQIRFSTGDFFVVGAAGCNAHYNGVFENGGNLNAVLDCTIDPVVEDVYHMPSVPHDLEDSIVVANVTDANNNIDSVVLHYALNGTNETAAMVLSSGLYTHNFGTLAFNTSISYEVWVNDTYGNMAASGSDSFTVISHDYDKDGSNSTVDCNDFDDTIYPGATEILDDIDQNCVNDAPVFSGTIPDQAWAEDTRNDAAFDLDSYFTDVDDHGKLSFSSAGTNDIVVVIDPDNVVYFNQMDNWNGAKQVVFTATDNKTNTSSNSVQLNVTPQPDAPRFLFNISDITVKETNLVDLNESGEVVATDADGDALSISYSCDILPCDLDSNGQWLTNLGDKGTYVANVTVSDGALSESQLIAIEVTKKYPGDLNDDNRVNVLDLIILRRAFGLTPGDTEWNADYDLNSDNAVNVLDLIILRRNFT